MKSKKAIIVIVTIVLVVGLASAFIFRKTNRELVVELSDRLSPPVGCPIEEIEKVYGAASSRSYRVWEQALPYVHLYYEFKLKSVGDVPVTLNIASVGGRVVRSGVTVDGGYSPVAETNMPLIDDIKKRIKDAKLVSIYRQAIELNCELYEVKVKELKEKKWPEVIYEDQMKLPYIDGPIVTAEPPLRVEMYVEESGEIYISSTQVEKDGLLLELIGLRKLIGGGGVVQINADSRAKVDCDLINIVIQSGLTKIYFMGYDKFKNLTFCRPIGIEYQSDEIKPKNLLVLQQEGRCIINKRIYDFNEVLPYLEKLKGYTAIKLRVSEGTSWSQFFEFYNSIQFSGEDGRGTILPVVSIDKP